MQPRAFEPALRMRSVWTPLGISIAIIGIVMVAVSTHRRTSSSPSFAGCFDYQGHNIVFRDLRVSVDGKDAGSFEYLRSDLSKGPDRIGVESRYELLRSIGVVDRYFWLVTADGIQLPKANGAYDTAHPCRG